MESAPTSTPAAAPSPAPSSAPDTSSAPSPAPSEGTSPSPSSAGAPPAPKPAPEPKRYKVKVDGQEMDVPEEELLRGYQTRAAAAKRFEEFAKAKKAFEEQQAATKKRLEDPRIVAAAQEWGVEPEEAAAILRVQDLVKREQMSPEARALADERKRREDLERKFKEAEEAKSQEQQQREVSVHMERLNKEIVEAAKDVGLPANPEVGRLMLGHMQTLAKAGLPFDAKESARYAMESARSISQTFLKGMNDEQLESFLTKPVIDRILARSVQRAKGQVGAVPQAAPPAPTPEPAQRRPLTIEEWRAKMAKDL